MIMASSYSLAFLTLFIMFLLGSNPTDARKGIAASEYYWKDVMNGQPLPESIKSLVVEESTVATKESDVANSDHKGAECETDHEVVLELAAEKIELQPKITDQHNDITPSKFVKDIKSQPQLSIYGKEAKPSKFATEMKPSKLEEES
ncbi:hypothetical protein LINPERHAP2_LOCUS30565 [Linum perenne]